MSNYLQQAKNDFEHAMGDVEQGYGDYLLDKATTETLIGIGETLEKLLDMFSKIYIGLEEIKNG